MMRRDPAGADVEIELEGSTGALTADAELIRAAVLNLLINAAQALDGRGRIVVRSLVSDTAAVIAVCDNGPGIPADIRTRVPGTLLYDEGPRRRTGTGHRQTQRRVARRLAGACVPSGLAEPSSR